MGWMPARCLIMNLIHFAMEMFYWYFGRTNFRSNSADLKDALESTPFMPDILERNMV